MYKKEHECRVSQFITSKLNNDENAINEVMWSNKVSKDVSLLLVSNDCGSKHENIATRNKEVQKITNNFNQTVIPNSNGIKNDFLILLQYQPASLSTISEFYLRCPQETRS